MRFEFIILFFFVVVAILTYSIQLYRQSAAKKRGKYGEKIVSSILMSLPDEYYLFNDIIIQRDGYSVQIDHVLISVYGIFVIETKNYKGWITGNESSEYWTKSVFGHKYQFLNPIIQNRSHVKALSRLFKIDENYFIPIVVFIDSAVLNCYTRSHVIYDEDLLDFICNYKKTIISFNDVQDYALILDAASLETSETRKEHMNKVYESIYNKQTLKSLGICPVCGGMLVERNGKYGPFIGCSNYPSCKYTTH